MTCLQPRVTFCREKGHSFWLCEDGNSSLGDMPVEPSSWLVNSFLESHRLVLEAPCQGPPFQDLLLCVFLWMGGLSQEHLLRRLWVEGIS